jgi:hypothetical protein
MARWIAVVTQTSLKDAGKKAWVIFCINCTLKYFQRSTKGRIEYFFNKGTVCALYTELQRIQMAIFCFKIIG